MKTLSAVSLLLLVACFGKSRPFGEALESYDAGGTAADPQAPDGPDASLEPVDSPSVSETPAPVSALDQPEGVSSAGSESLSCEADAAACGPLEDAGPPPAVCVPAPRDCRSELDNDCDGQPDNLADDVCVCVPDTVQACNEHPGLDGNGQCRAGSQTCLFDPLTLSTDWGECQGDVGPGGQDSCAAGDDTNCNGIPNEGCACNDGDTTPCGTDVGICQRGVQTCVNGTFPGQCVGAVTAGARDCNSPQDNDCDGRPDNTIDNVCRCSIGSTQACQTHPGLDGNGQCRAGSQTCLAGPGNASSGFGGCTGSFGPSARDCRSAQDNDCDGRPDNTIDNVCRCSIGSTQACQTHPGLDGNGRCSAGSQTCVAGPGDASSGFSGCAGSVGPATRDCRSAQDNDCDGRPDNSCSDDPNNARCNGQGQCVPCQSNPDCSLVSGGRNTCQGGRCVACSGCAVNGACVADGANHPTELCQICDASTKTFVAALDGSLCSFTPPASCLSGRCDLPEAFECSASISTATTLAPLPSVFVQNPNPVVQNFEPSAGVLNGRYLINSVESESQVAPVVGELIEFRDRDKAYRRMRTTYVGGQPVSTVVDIGSYGLNVDSVTLNGTECSGGATPIAERWRYNSAGFFLNVSRQSGRVEVFTPTTL